MGRSRESRPKRVFGHQGQKFLEVDSMRILSAVLLAACMTMLLGILSPNATASEWSKKTIVTFNEPVEIPGHVLLPGTYIFRLMDSPSDRNIVQVWTGDRKECVATVLTETATDPNPAPKGDFTFVPGVAKSPERIKTWFYSGDFSGQQFLYPPISVHSPSLPGLARS